MAQPSEYEQQRVIRLHRMLRALIAEQPAVQPVDPVRAGHLADAIDDLRTLIERMRANGA